MAAILPSGAAAPPRLGGTGDPPVPSGDPPDGTEASFVWKKTAFSHVALCNSLLFPIPVGKSPTKAGKSPAPHPRRS